MTTTNNLEQPSRRKSGAGGRNCFGLIRLIGQPHGMSIAARLSVNAHHTIR